MSRSHGQSTPREPWVFSEEAQDAFLKINKLRYRLLPYIYSVAYETHDKGLPMMRPMMLEFQEDFATKDINTQYMLGDALLVAPYFDQKVHRVYLPEGSWVDWYTRERIRGGRWIVCEKKIDRIPLFIRENAAIPIFREAPMHIEDRNFTGYDLVLNLTDHLEKTFHDDGFEGYVKADIRDGKVYVTTNLPAEGIEVLSDKPFTEVIRESV